MWADLFIVWLVLAATLGIIVGKMIDYGKEKD